MYNLDRWMDKYPGMNGLCVLLGLRRNVAETFEISLRQIQRKMKMIHACRMAGNGKDLLEQWMGQLMEVELADTRRVRGYLVCTDNGPNIVLNQGVERWPDDAGPGRNVGLVMVAPKNIKNLWHVALEPVAPVAAAGGAASARRDEEENTRENKDEEKKDEQSGGQMDHIEWNKMANQLREAAGSRQVSGDCEADHIEQQWRRRQARQERLGTTREPNFLFKMARDWCPRDGRMQPDEPLSPFKWTNWEEEWPRQAKQWKISQAEWETKREEWIQMLEPTQRAAIEAAQQAAARYRERVNLKVYDGAPPPRVDKTFRAELLRLLGEKDE